MGTDWCPENDNPRFRCLFRNKACSEHDSETPEYGIDKL